MPSIWNLAEGMRHLKHSASIGTKRKMVKGIPIGATGEMLYLLWSIFYQTVSILFAD